MSLSSDPLAILAAHDAWATRRLLETCRGLTREQFHRKFPIGLGSLHDNLTHIVGVMRRWADRIAERELRAPIAAIPGVAPSPDVRERTADELLALLAEAEEDLRRVMEAARARGLGATITAVWPGPDGTPRPVTFTRGAALTHLYTHGEWHRAQCVNMLRHLDIPGVSDRLPAISVTAWQTEVEGA